MCSYLLWKGRHRHQLTWPHVLSGAVALDDAGRQHATTLVQQHALSRKLSAQEKDDLLAELADRLDIDYQELCRKCLMQFWFGQRKLENW